MSKKKNLLKEKFNKFMSIFIIVLMLGGVLLPAFIVLFDIFAGN